MKNHLLDRKAKVVTNIEYDIIYDDIHQYHIDSDGKAYRLAHDMCNNSWWEPVISERRRDKEDEEWHYAAIKNAIPTYKPPKK